ncbi:hypothetical protein LINGRAHAP2_LOCUS5101 [Linum grandiflorum]
MRRLRKALSGSLDHSWNACVGSTQNPSSVISVLLLVPVLGPFSQKHSMDCVHSTLGRMLPKTSAWSWHQGFL